MLNKIKRIFCKYTYKDYVYFALQVVVLILVARYFVSRFSPIAEAAKYTHPGMDDYWMSYGVHHTWMNSHSLIECIQRAWEETVRVYNNYNGNFLSMFLTSLSPVAFNENRYHLIFYIMLADMVIGLGMIAYSLLHRRWKMSILNCISICLLFLVFYLDYAPSAREGIYWWPGIANYNLFFGMILFAQGVYILFWEKHRPVWLVLSTIVFFLIGLGNPLTGLVNVCLLAYELIYEIYRKKSFKTLFYIPLAAAIAGLLIAVTAPGAATRLSADRVTVLETIIMSFKDGTIMTRASIQPAVYFYLIMVAGIALFDMINKKSEAADEAVKGAAAKKIIGTVIYVVMMACLYYASFAPLMYARSQYFGRVLNTTTFVYFMTATVSIIYVCRTVAYFVNRALREQESEKKVNVVDIKNWAAGIVALVCMICCVRTVEQPLYKSVSLALNADYALTYQFARLYDEDRDRIFMELLDPDINPVHIGKITYIGFYPEIRENISDMEQYYDKQIIVDTEE